MAGGPGFEPRLSGPEPEVLPLNYPPKRPMIGTYLKELSPSIFVITGDKEIIMGDINIKGSKDGERYAKGESSLSKKGREVKGLNFE